MLVGLAVVPGCLDSGVSAMLDVMRTAEALRTQSDPKCEPIGVVLVGSKEPVRTGLGMALALERRLSDQDPFAGLDVVVVAGLGVGSAAWLDEQLSSTAVRALVGALRELPPERRVAAACTGTFVLAQAGLLDGRAATTSWWLSAEFARRYDDIALDLSRRLVHDGTITTAGAGFAHAELALSLVAGVSARLADRVARFLLIGNRPGPATETSVGDHASGDPLVTEFETWVRTNIAGDVSIGAAVAALGTTRRTLERRTHARTGLTPNTLVQRLRVEHANHLRRTTGQTIGQIAPLVGYRNAATLRALLRRHGP